MSDDVTKEQKEEAKRVLRQAYYQEISNEVADLVRAYFDGEYQDEEGQTEFINGVCDGAVTYTAECYDIVFASENSGNGFDALRDMGIEAGNDAETLIGRWAYFVYENDIRDLLGNGYADAAAVVNEAMGLDLDDQQRLVWLAAHRTRHFLMQDSAEAYCFLIGTSGDGEQRGDPNLGVVTLTTSLSGLKADRHTINTFFTELFDGDPGLERIQQVARLASQGDEGAWRVLNDLCLERNVQLGVEPTYESSEAPGEELPLTHVLEENVEDLSTAAELLALKVGEQRDLGGGAVGELLVKRLR